MANIEVQIVDWLNASDELRDFGAAATLEIPSVRPKRFLTVERTGGPLETFRDLPMLVIHAWAEYRDLAGDLAKIAADAVRDSVALPNVARVRVTGMHNFPDPDSKQPRYQIVVELVTKDD